VSRRTLLTCVVIVAMLAIGGVLLVRAVDPGETDAGVTGPAATPAPTTAPAPSTFPGATPAPLSGAQLGRCPQASDGRIGTDPLTPPLPGSSPRTAPSPTKPHMQVCPATG
jgi:hypothetical protein